MPVFPMFLTVEQNAKEIQGALARWSVKHSGMDKATLLEN